MHTLIQLAHLFLHARRIEAHCPRPVIVRVQPVVPRLPPPPPPPLPAPATRRRRAAASAGVVVHRAHRF